MKLSVNTIIMKTKSFVEYGFLLLIFCFSLNTTHAQTVKVYHQIQLAQKIDKSSRLVQQCYFPVDFKIHTKSI